MRKITVTVTPDTREDTFEKICCGFRKQLSGDVEFVRVDDSGIIGGFIADDDGDIYDLSVRSQLEKMAKHIED